jgi:hypothetical protein
MKRLKCLHVLSFIIAIAIFGSCGAKSANEKIAQNNILTTNKIVINENFNEFYKKFYGDSLFQLSRITFPLKGFNSDEYNEELGDKNPQYFWKKNEWTFLETLPQNYVKYDKKEWIEEYKKEIKHKKDSSVLEKIYMVDSGYIEERVFKLIKGKWFLVFYSYNNF